MTKRILSSIFGAFLFTILVPVAYLLAFENLPLDGFFASLILLGIIGCVLGAILGYLFPKIFGFIFEMFMDF